MEKAETLKSQMKAAQKSEELSRQSSIQPRMIMINRVQSVRNKSSSQSPRSSSSFGGLTAAVYKQLSSMGVTDFKDNREKEKREMQKLNERLASYIEKVHFLDAKVKNLEAENEALQNQKGLDIQPIRDAYESELVQARKTIDEMAITKGVSESRELIHQEEVSSLREIIATYEKQSKDYTNKIDTLSTQIIEYEADIRSLRLKVASSEDKVIKIQDVLTKCQEQNKRLCVDLATETAAHVEFECLCQTKNEEVVFYKELLEQVKMVKPEPVRINGLDQSSFWKSELSKCIQEIQQTYEEKLEEVQKDMELKYESVVASTQSSTVRENVQLVHVKEEVMKLKMQLQEKTVFCSQLTTRISTLESERQVFLEQIQEYDHQLDELRIKYSKDINDSEVRLSEITTELQSLGSANLSLEMEIALYKKLLESEESRVMPQNVGGQGVILPKEELIRNTEVNSE